jgi:hypothetical protein
MMVAPVPILSALFGWQRAKFTVRPVGLHNPLAIEDDFIVVPRMVVAVIGIVNPDPGVFGASGKDDGRSNRNSH